MVCAGIKKAQAAANVDICSIQVDATNVIVGHGFLSFDLPSKSPPVVITDLGVQRQVDYILTDLKDRRTTAGHRRICTG